MRPQSSEHSPYYGRYISLVPDGDLMQLFETETAATRALLDSISEQQSLHRYAPGKWSIRESVVHVSDAERIFTYRALCFARGDKTELPGIEPEDYVVLSAAAGRSWPGIIGEYVAVRGASLALFENLPDDAWSRGGVASGSPFSVRALAYIVVGHDIHHRKVLQQSYL